VPGIPHFRDGLVLALAEVREIFEREPMRHLLNNIEGIGDYVDVFQVKYSMTCFFILTFGTNKTVSTTVTLTRCDINELQRGLDKG
jgi:hypothetical protein